MNTFRTTLAFAMASLVIGVAAMAATPDERGKQLLFAGLKAERAVSYSAEQQAVIFARGKRTEVKARIFHQAPDKTRIEFIAPENMAGSILVHKGDKAYRYLKGKNWQQSHWGLSEDRTDLLFANYRVTFSEEENVEGRRAREVRIRPKHPGNPSKTLWFDQATGVMLRYILRNSRREEISSMQFTNFQVNPSLGYELFETKGASSARDGHEGRDHHPAPRKPIMPTYLPPGYVQAGVSGIELKDFRAIHLKFTDGLNTISLFERSGAEGHERGETTDKDRLSRALHWTAGGWGFTLIADLAPEELQRIADSVKTP